MQQRFFSHSLPRPGSLQPVTRPSQLNSSFHRHISTKIASSPRHEPTENVVITGNTGSSLPHLAAVAIVASSLAFVDPSLALEIHTEPSNALSLPTWMVHTSSVMEWTIAIGLMWQYSEAVDNPLWKGMAWGMLPCLGSAFCAVIYHFFYNAHILDFLVTLQAALTVVGNFTCWIAAYRIYIGAQSSNNA